MLAAPQKHLGEPDLISHSSRMVRAASFYTLVIHLPAVNGLAKRTVPEEADLQRFTTNRYPWPDHLDSDVESHVCVETAFEELRSPEPPHPKVQNR